MSTSQPAHFEALGGIAVEAPVGLEDFVSKLAIAPQSQRSAAVRPDQRSER